MRLQKDVNSKHAFDMLQTFVQHSNEAGNLSEEGFRLLHEQFGAVEKRNRAEVFMMFTEMLDNRGIKYHPGEF